jgi:hypothetical protein
MKIGADPGGGVGPLPIVDGEISTGVYGDYELESPCRFFGLQVVGTTDAVAVLEGSLASSSDAVFSTVISWSSDTVGAILGAESTAPISRVRVSLNGGASSGTPLYAWFAASP